MLKVLIFIVFVTRVHTQPVSDTVVLHIDQGPVRGHRDAANHQEESESKLVEIEQGLVRGHREGGIYTFLNIPYATAPTGPDRFKAPLPPPRWTSEFDAVDRGVICPQMPLLEHYQEDCLVANIFVPNTNATNLPVMVVVHGGAYMVGAGADWRYTDLVRTKNIVVVTFNYRLGTLGFLCLGTKDIPGNAGMKDQVALLRWVNRNIASFGGNPDDVTMNGCSAGGAAVDLLSISPMTTGLFKKVISNSAVGIGPVGAQMDPLDNAKAYARALNFTNVDDIEALEDFFKTVPIETFLQFQVPFDSAIPMMSFSPCIEADNGGDEERFLPDSPWSIIRNRNYTALPILYGFTDYESSLFTTYFDSISAMMNSDFHNYLPSELQFESEQQREEVANAVKQFYFGENPVDFNNLQNYLNYFNDMMFGYQFLRTINHRRENNNDPIYLFKYTFVDDNTPFVLNSTIRGAEHCAQELIVTDHDVTNVTPEHLMMRDLMRELYFNFIISGQPSAVGLTDWSPISGKWSPYMALNNESTLVSTAPLADRADMWDDLYSEHARLPVPPNPSSQP